MWPLLAPVAKARTPFFTDRPARAPEWALLHSAADAAYPTFLAAWLAAFHGAQDAVAVEPLTARLSAGDVLGAELLLRDAWRSAGLGPLPETLQPLLTDTVARGAAAAMARWPRLTGAAFAGRFDLDLPEARAFLRRFGADLVREIDATTREGIRAVVQQGFTEGFPPAQMARQLRGSLGLTAHQLGPVERYHAKLLADGMPPARAEALRAKLMARKLRERAVTIARTETITAASAGQHLVWQQAAAQGLVPVAQTRRVWVVTPDDRSCPQCREIPKNNAAGVRLDEPFETPYGLVLYPAAHPKCRCAVILRFVEV